MGEIQLSTWWVKKTSRRHWISNSAVDLEIFDVYRSREDQKTVDTADPSRVFRFSFPLPGGARVKNLCLVRSATGSEKIRRLECARNGGKEREREKKNGYFGFAAARKTRSGNGPSEDVQYDPPRSTINDFLWKLDGFCRLRFSSFALFSQRNGIIIFHLRSRYVPARIHPSDCSRPGSISDANIWDTYDDRILFLFFFSGPVE